MEDARMKISWTGVMRSTKEEKRWTGSMNRSGKFGEGKCGGESRVLSSFIKLSPLVLPFLCLLMYWTIYR